MQNSEHMQLESKNTHESVSQSVSQGSGLTEVSLDLFQTKIQLQTEHQKILSACFENYFAEFKEQIEKKEQKEQKEQREQETLEALETQNDQSEQISIEPIDFSSLNYIQTVCCGVFLNKEEVIHKLRIAKLKSMQSEGCCQNCRLEEQLYCMNLGLRPNHLKLNRQELAFELLKAAIKNKYYFLLEQLLLIRSLSVHIDMYDSYSKALLHYALDELDPISTLILIKHGADVNAVVRHFHYSLEYLYLYNCKNNLERERQVVLEKILKSYGGLSRVELDLSSVQGTSRTRTYAENKKLHDAFKDLRRCGPMQTLLLHNACRHADESIDRKTDHFKLRNTYVDDSRGIASSH